MAFMDGSIAAAGLGDVRLFQVEDGREEEKARFQAAHATPSQYAAAAAWSASGPPSRGRAMA